ncbi:MAG: diphthamide biosynthesis enzyme Dph2 [Methanosarcinaceae archaeon]
MSSSEAFDLKIEYMIDVIKRVGPTNVGLQFPEGFKRRAMGIASRLEDATDAAVEISANPCYGACDLDTALIDSNDIVFHFGHSELNDTTYSEKVYFIEAASSVNVKEVAAKALDILEGQHIGLITTVQHVHKLNDVRRVLEDGGKQCVIAIGDSRMAYPGQILGCNFSSARTEDCDEYLYIGSGEFHPIGVSLATGRPVYVADPFVNEVHRVDHSKILRQRSASIAKSLDASLVGIVVSTKTGQNRMQLALSLKEMAKRHGKEAHILSMDLITPEQLLQFKVDVYVNTACPRIAIDETGRFPAPMLTPPEFEIVCGERQWEELVFDEIRGE